MHELLCSSLSQLAGNQTDAECTGGNDSCGLSRVGLIAYLLIELIVGDPFPSNALAGEGEYRIAARSQLVSHFIEYGLQALHGPSVKALHYAGKYGGQFDICSSIHLPPLELALPSSPARCLSEYRAIGRTAFYLYQPFLPVHPLPLSR